MQPLVYPRTADVYRPGASRPLPIPPYVRLTCLAGRGTSSRQKKPSTLLGTTPAGLRRSSTPIPRT
eukprot:scaffold10401_cov65-Phaeocystis_antarctica.AAC.7